MSFDGLLEGLFWVLLGVPVAAALVMCLLLIIYGFLTTNKLLYPNLLIIAGVNVATCWVGIVIYFLTVNYLPFNNFYLPIGAVAVTALLLNYRIHRHQIAQQAAA